MTETFRNALILTGPTGSGKSQLALDLAEGMGAEIICMDSMTLYRGMDIGTAKPSREDRHRVPHHLLDVLDPWESASVSWWLQRAQECCRAIEGRGRRVLLVGGTPLYLKAILHGLFDGPPADAQLRQRLEEEAGRLGREALHARLVEIDPATAARLHANDLRRVIRALEVHELTGKPISTWQTQWNARRDESAQKGAPRCLCLDLPRETLYRRIDARVEQMIRDGLVEEVQGLRKLTQPLSREARQALGYKELFAHLDGQTSLEEAILQIQTRTRNFAKRQLSWFRHMPECQMVGGQLTFAVEVLTIGKDG
jgi:tRNA dimethylallyltransferase